MPALILLFSLLVLSQSALFVRLADSHAVVIGFWRMMLTLPVLLALALWQGKARALQNLNSQQWRRLALCGFFLFAHFYTWFLSVQKTSLAHAMILFCSNPLFTAIGAWFFFREKASWRHGLAMALCFTGIYFLLFDKAGVHSLEGDVLGILCAVLFSAYVLVGKGIRQSLDNISFTLVIYSVCTLCFLVAMLGLGLPFFGYGWNAWAGFAGLAIGSTLLGHALFTHCLQYFHVNFLSISTLVEPAFTALTGYWIYNEPVTRAGILGFLFVGAGILSLYLPYLLGKMRRP